MSDEPTTLDFSTAKLQIKDPAAQIRRSGEVYIFFYEGECILLVCGFDDPTPEQRALVRGRALGAVEGWLLHRRAGPTLAEDRKARGAPEWTLDMFPEPA